MSLNIKDARETLDIMEKIADNPSLILTNLFSGGVSSSSFIYNIKMDGKYISEYCIECLKTLDAFRDVELKFSSYEMHVKMEGLDFVGDYPFKTMDEILHINLSDKTYVLTDCVKRYTNEIEAKYELKLEEMEQFWNKYENYNFRKRMKTAFGSFSSDKKVMTKMHDFIFNLTVPKSKVTKAYNAAYEKVKMNNEWRSDKHEAQLRKQMFYAKNAPEHIKLIRNKQAELEKYLKELGYIKSSEDTAAFAEIIGCKRKV